jgi:hypothetical protein
MEDSTISKLDARNLFRQAYGRARRQDVLAWLERKPNDLLPFEALQEILHAYQQIPQREPQVIPLDKIVGSVGRYRDFTRDFMPRHSAMRERWVQIDAAMSSPEGVPPIDVFKVGDVYFVADGNHRVSVARANGFKEIDAYVTEIPADAGIEPGDTLDEAILKADRTRFLAETKLDRHFDSVDIYFTKPGGYTRLLRHIEAHRSLMNRAQDGAGEVSFEDAAVDWYTHVYQPIVASIRDRQLLRHFPNRTAADLYIWIWNTIEEWYRLFGERVDLDEATALLELRASVAPSPFRQAVQELMGWLGEISHLSPDRAAQAPDWAEPAFEWGDTSDLSGAGAQ